MSAISKIYERVLFKQISDYFEKIFTVYLCGFRKGYKTKYAIFKLLHDWQSCLDTKRFVSAVLMDLSKACNCLPHDLIIAKLEAYGFDEHSLRLTYDYLTNRKQRVKVGSALSDCLV